MLVLDTNILVAALWSRTGASYRLVELVLQRRLPIAISVALALAYEAALSRTTMREASWATADELDQLLDAVLAAAMLVMPIRTRLRPALADPDDEMVLECAVQAGANAIVTMNAHDFANAMTLYRLETLKPGEALARWREQLP